MKRDSVIERQLTQQMLLDKAPFSTEKHTNFHILRRNHHNQKLRKGVGGLRGLARGIPSYARDSGHTFLENFLALFGGLFVANP